MLAAEAKKAGSASEDTRLTPRPPSLTGKLACNHWMSVIIVIYYSFLSYAADRQIESQMRMNALLPRLSSA